MDKRFSSKTITNIDQTEIGDSLEYLGVDGGPMTLFGMDKSEEFYQRDQAAIDREMEKKKADKEADQLHAFRASAGRRSDATIVARTKSIKLGDKMDKRPLSVPVKIVPQKKRKVVEADEEGVGERKHSRAGTNSDDASVGALAKDTDVTVIGNSASLFDYASSDEDS